METTGVIPDFSGMTHFIEWALYQSMGLVPGRQARKYSTPFFPACAAAPLLDALFLCCAEYDSGSRLINDEPLGIHPVSLAGAYAGVPILV